MPRRIASQVHKAVSRLMRGSLIASPPAWYSAVLTYPPLPLPPRSNLPRSSDLPPPRQTSHHSPDAHHRPSKHFRTPKPRLQRVVYLEDKIRVQFFKDHPFEAFRPRSLVENQEIGEWEEGKVEGAEWTRLSQRGRNPTSEDAIQFAASLHTHHALPLSEAYKSSIQQYRALRSEYHVATNFAAYEAQRFGAWFKPSEVESAFQMEAKALETWVGHGGVGGDGMGDAGGKRPWTLVWEDGTSKEATEDGVVVSNPDPLDDGWTRGQAYAQRLQKGERPDFRLHKPADSTPKV